MYIYVRNNYADTIHTDFRGFLFPRGSYMYKLSRVSVACVIVWLHECGHLYVSPVQKTHRRFVSRSIGVWNVRMADRRWRIKPVSLDRLSHCSTLGRSSENMKNLCMYVSYSTYKTSIFPYTYTMSHIHV